MYVCCFLRQTYNLLPGLSLKYLMHIVRNMLRETIIFVGLSCATDFTYGKSLPQNQQQRQQYDETASI